MSRLPDNPDRDFSAGCEDDIAENLFESLVAGYSQLIDDPRVRFRIDDPRVRFRIREIIARAMSRPNKFPGR